MVAKNGEKDNYARAGLRKLSLNKYLKNTVQNAFLLKILKITTASELDLHGRLKIITIKKNTSEQKRI